jgi:hypothetical protein
MAEPWNKRIDLFARSHPRLMVALTLLAAFAMTIVLLVFSQDQKILYKAF